VKQGHEVTLYASADSVTSARLVPCCERSLRLDEKCVDPLPHHLRMLELVFRDLEKFDMVHFHIDYLHYPLVRCRGARTVTTLHGKLTTPDLVPLYREFREIPLVSISDSQRDPLPWLNWQATVYHGLPEDLHGLHSGAGGYLAFVGRVSPEKGVDRAIEIARRAGVPLKVAAKISEDDRDYFETQIKPMLTDPIVEFLGEIGEEEKGAFLGNAAALLFPIDWPEPFGLAMIEAMACGTPVIAYRRGSVPEVVDHGVTGLIVETIEEAVGAVRRVGKLSRKRCRHVFEERFSARRMARDYVNVYGRLLAGRACRHDSAA
jgi:glycosyltransferase involved in cell wall biosynthesis